MTGHRAALLLRTSVLLLAACSASFAAASTALAQIGRSGAGSPATRGVQPSGNAQLNEALVRLGTNPQDIDALLDASNAALQLGDTDAAIGFLTRADTVSPGNVRVKALMGSALVRNENPYDAISYFSQAEAAGADVAGLASDRGLAFDLVGNQSSAQAFYRIAMAKTPGEEVTRRYALSLAISGDRRMADSVLGPLIQRQDPAAWRTRVFILAISGQEEEAISVARAMMPASLADGIAPYLRYMPRLTRAQQVAAATFGKFPRAADIGRDDPRAARFASVAPAAPAIVSTSDTGKAGRNRDSRNRAIAGRERRPDVPVQQPARLAEKAQPVGAAGNGTTGPAPRLAAPAEAPSKSAAGAVRVQQHSMPPVVSSGSASVTPAPAATAPAVPTSSVSSPAKAPGAIDFGSAFGNFQPPPAERTAPVVAVDVTRIQPRSPASVDRSKVSAPKPVATRGARPDAPTDVSRVTDRSAELRIAAKDAKTGAAKTGVAKIGVGKAGADKAAVASAKPGTKAGTTEKATTEKAGAASADKGGKGKTATTDKTDKTKSDKATAGKSGKSGKAGAKAAKVTHPARIWVQLSTGGNREALPKDWSRLTRAAPQALRGKKPYVTAWRGNFRLLTGPFADEAAARTFVNQLRKDDVSAFSWTSAEGQEVDSMPAAGKSGR